MTTNPHVLAAGGFEADPGPREHLGEGWKRRGARHPPRHRRHARRRPAHRGGHGRRLVQRPQRPVGRLAPRQREQPGADQPAHPQSYPLGIVVNRDGERFVDEGADFRNYTYARYGKGSSAARLVAFQLYDADSAAAADRGVRHARRLGGRGGDPRGAGRRHRHRPGGAGGDRRWVQRRDRPRRAFDPTVKDGRAALVDPPKSNWAIPLETPPFYAYPVTCGITFTFGGLNSDTDGRCWTATARRSRGSSFAGRCSAVCSAATTPAGRGWRPERCSVGAPGRGRS